MLKDKKKPWKQQEKNDSWQGGDVNMINSWLLTRNNEAEVEGRIQRSWKIKAAN